MQLVIHGQKKKPYVNNLEVKLEGGNFWVFEAILFLDTNRMSSINIFICMVSQAREDRNSWILIPGVYLLIG